MTLKEYLERQREDLPGWLGGFTLSDAFPREQFFASRVVYYPGSGTDGHPVKLFGSTHSAHCFVYADYGVPQQQIEGQLAARRGFRGYHTFARLQLCERDLVPGGWTPHVGPDEVLRDKNHFANVAPFGFLEVLERNANLNDTHGARRLAVLFLGADGIATYDAIFCQKRGTVPFAVLLQDHGFGGNYDKFGRGGLLESIVMRSQCLPSWLLVAEYTTAWQGFDRVPDVEGDRGGMHRTLRLLYERREHQPARTPKGVKAYYHSSPFRFLGLPGGRSVDSRASRFAIRDTHASSPNGTPRSRLRRMAASSFSS